MKSSLRARVSPETALPGGAPSDVWLPLAVLVIAAIASAAAWRAFRAGREGAWVVIASAVGTLVSTAVVTTARRAARSRGAGAPSTQETVTFAERPHPQPALPEDVLHLRDIAEHVGAVVWHWVLEPRRLAYVSPSYERIWGRSCASLYADPESWIKAVHPDDRSAAAMDFGRVVERSTHDDRRYRIVRPDGTLRWIRDRAFVVRDVDGAVRGVAGLAEDVTELETGATMLRGERTIFAMVARHAPLAETLDACCRLVEELCPGVRASIVVRDAEAPVVAAGATVWSHPLIDEAGAVLGTFSVHHRVPRATAPTEVAVIERIRDLAVIATKLTEAEARLRGTQFAVENVADLVFRITSDGRIVDVNPAACRRLGYSREELTQLTLADIDPDYPASAWPATWARLRDVGQWRLESRHCTKDGEIYPVDVTANYVEHDGSAYSYAIVRDITDWKRGVAALETSEERLRLATEAGHMGIWDWNIETERLECSPEMRRLFGVSAQQVTAADFRGAVHADDEARVTAGLVAARRGAAVEDLEFRAVWPDGSVHWLANHCRVYRDADGRGARMIGIVTDIDHRKAAEREREALLTELRAANAMQTRLSRQLLEVQENERRDLSRDLHDEIGQCVAAAKINLDLLARRLSTVVGETSVADTVALLDHILRHVSRICLELRPSVLDDLGLAAALRGYVHRQAERGGWRAELRADDLPPLDDRVRGVCFRIVQEALTNVVRHARARAVVVELRRGDEALVLRVRDDGVGFDPVLSMERPSSSGGLGLLGMRERLSGVGGTLRVESAVGRGTVVEASIPFAQELTEPLASGLVG